MCCVRVSIVVKMNKKLAFRFATISGITIGSFITGIAYERNRCINLVEQSGNPYLLYSSDDIKKVSSFGAYSCSLNLKFI